MQSEAKMPGKSRFVHLDFDGLLADTEPMHMKAFDLAFEKLGIGAKSKPEKWVGKSTKEILEEVIKDTRTKIPLEEIRKVRRELFREISMESKLMPFCKETLERLSRRFSLSLVTSSGKGEIGPFLEKHGLVSFFKVMVFADDVKRLKPFPDLYLLAQEKAGVEGGFALEDSEQGVCAAKNAGLTCFAVPNEYTKNQDLSLADRTFRNLHEAGTFLSGLP